MSEPFLGQIQIFPYNFAPVGWATCNGQILSIAQNAALFSLLGTFYGGNGTSTFALPQLAGCVPVDAGQGVGLSQRNVGDAGGEASVTLDVGTLPQHEHAVNASTNAGDSRNPNGMLPAIPATPPRMPDDLYSNTTLPTSQMLANSVLPVGGGQPHNNLQPYLMLLFCIALTGIFPPRN
jgi:microcystin-dependent protein